MIAALRMVQRNALVYKRAWRESLLFSFLQPTLFLLAMGVGMGTLVERGGSSVLGGVDYLSFLGPGLLAAACMQTASFESSYPITGKMTWQRNYEAIAATPMRIVDMVLGELAWIALRVGAVAVAFTIVLSLFAIPRSPLVVLAIPAAMLTGLAFSAVIIAYSASLKNSKGFNYLFRFGITPLFLFSGVFFPISRLPVGLRMVARWTPLFHGVELTRSLTLGTVDSSGWTVHVGYLAVMLGAGILAAHVSFRRRLEA